MSTRFNWWLPLHISSKPGANGLDKRRFTLSGGQHQGFLKMRLRLFGFSQMVKHHADVPFGISVVPLDPQCLLVLMQSLLPSALTGQCIAIIHAGETAIRIGF